VRLSFLDSVRGIAAFIVMCAHIHYAIRPPTVWLDTTMLRILNTSTFAVAVFFVLSGFVLFLQVKRESIGYLPFVVRRAFRILPASTVTITLSWLIYYFWQPAPMTTLAEPWFNQVSWPPGITFGTYLSDLKLIGSATLVPQAWSLVQEWRISLIFPLLAIAFTALPRAVSVATFAFALSLIGPLFGLSRGAWAAYAITAFYGSFFVGGMIVAMYWRELALLLRRYPIIKSLAGLWLAYFLLLKPQVDGFDGWLGDALVGCILIIFCLGSSKARWVLRMRLPRYLGKISYSLYLIHIIWLGIMFRVLDGVNPLAIAVIVIFASALSADLMNRMIEVPLNRVGRVIARQLSEILKRYSPLKLRAPANIDIA
jgi:peptidoglycan/LPS O-acetylase OafA/YrhL